MQPSTAGPDPERGSALRRYGPIIAIVVVGAIIAAVVAFAGGGDDDEGAEEAATGGAETTTEAISYSQAQEEGLDVTFPETCDEERGRVAIPYYFAAECYANVEGDNGGATAPGVTADSITVVVFIPPDNDPIYDFVTTAIANDDTAAQYEETYAGYVDLFESHYQTYGRKIDLKFVRGSGYANDEVAARADAVKAAEEHGAFAVLASPFLTAAWTDELKARGVVCIGCLQIPEPEPSVFSIVAGNHQTNVHVAEYVTKKLADGKAEHAGDPDLQGQDRVFGHLYIETSQASVDNARQLADDLSAGGVELAEQLSYQLDPVRLQEQAASVIARFKAAGVTSVIIQGDPVAPATFTREATAQEYFPEWVIGGSALIDTTAFGRSYDQEQWAHSFGISSLAARTPAEVATGYELYEWFTGSPPPADDSSGVLFPPVSALFSGIQAAGPELTAETFRQGLFSLEPAGRAVTQSYVSYGERGIWEEPDHYGIDDFTELWWDPEVQGPDEIRKDGTGMYRYVDGGMRYLPGDWTEDLKVFDPEGTVTLYEEPPEDERPPEYPSPAGGG